MSAAPDLARDDVDADLVRKLIALQFPQWRDLPVRPAAPGGWDNKTFHLGETMSVRLPSAARYAAQVEKEHRWLARLAPQLPLPIPQPLALGAASEQYPWPWSIYRWIDGETATHAAIGDLASFAVALADFLVALQRIDPADGPPPGPHNFFRGGPLSVYDGESRQAIDALGAAIDGENASLAWRAGLQVPWNGPPVWVHGDVTPGNLLVLNTQLSAVIDFGCCGVGDPACDLAIAWTLFEGESRKAFRDTLQCDEDLWTRGRAWALWKALILRARRASNHADADGAERVIDQVLADCRGAS